MKKPIKSNLLVWILCIATGGLAILFWWGLVEVTSLDTLSPNLRLVVAFGAGLLLPRLLQRMLRFAKRHEEEEPNPPGPGIFSN